MRLVKKVVVLPTLSLKDRIMKKKPDKNCEWRVILEAFATIFPLPRKSQLIPSSRKTNFSLNDKINEIKIK